MLIRKPTVLHLYLASLCSRRLRAQLLVSVHLFWAGPFILLSSDKQRTLT